MSSSLLNAGYWAENGWDLRRRHRPWVLLLCVILVLGFISLVLLGIPFIPRINSLTPFVWPLRQLIKAPVFGIPLVAVAYPVYVMLCVGFSVGALRTEIAGARSNPPHVSFRRSRRQLIAASLVLLLVSILVAVAVVWTITNTREGEYYVLRTDDVSVLAAFDFVIAVLISTVAVLLGQAMTRYELFTGQALPRRGLARHWVQAIVLAAGYGVLLGGALVLGLEPVYAVLLTAVLMTLFFALLGWRSWVEWRQAMRQLRPVVTSEGWYERLTGESGAPAEPVKADPLAALCQDVLGAPLAYLLPMGPLASFVLPLVYPPGAALPAAAWRSGAITSGQLAAAINPQEYGGASWAVPLWSERGLIGVLLLGAAADGRLYSEEELEIARAAGERLVDTAASLALSRRLMTLQREQMVQTQLLDQRTRRVLHDEVLPLIHTAMLAVAGGGQKDGLPDRANALERLADAHRQVSALLRDLPAATTPDVARLGALAALRKAVEGEFGNAFESVTWEVDTEAERAAAGLPPLKAETLYFAGRELVRNAARHARPQSGGRPSLKVSAALQDDAIRVVIEDNGSGWDGRAAPGHGLELHTALMAIAGGSLSVTGAPAGARAELVLPAK